MNIHLRMMTGLCAVALMLLSCDNGLRQGDPDYWTSSRGQFTAVLDNDSTMYFLDNGNGTATVTFDGSNPRHWISPTNATVSVTTYRDTVVIPETVVHNGKTLRVTAIGNEAFMGCRQLGGVVIPESVTSIGEGAFLHCDSLTLYNIPSGVTELKTSTFARCKKLTVASVPANVKHIGKMCFYGDSKLATIQLAEGVESIGEMAFFLCTNSALSEVIIPSTVKEIGNLAFGNEAGQEKTYSRITSYYVRATNPPTLLGELHNRPTSQPAPVIYVPKGSKAAYQAAQGWNSLTIEEEETL